MINLDLINKNISHVKNSIINRQSTTSSYLLILKDVLQQEILDKLKKYLDTVDNRKWQTVEGQENSPRQRISWDGDTVIEELHEIFQSLTEEINLIFPGVRKNFWGISIWKDSPGYKIDWHTDNPDIDVAMQIYIFNDPGLGTIFRLIDGDIVVPSESNTGYLVCHTGDNKIPHRTENIIPDGIVRYSLYAVWSRFPKHTADAH
jgi:hypothetical protein